MDSHNQELTIDKLIEMHEHLEEGMTVENLTEGLSFIDLPHLESKRIRAVRIRTKQTKKREEEKNVTSAPSPPLGEAKSIAHAKIMQDIAFTSRKISPKPSFKVSETRLRGVKEKQMRNRSKKEIYIDVGASSPTRGRFSRHPPPRMRVIRRGERMLIPPPPPGMYRSGFSGRWENPAFPVRQRGLDASNAGTERAGSEWRMREKSGR
ncbi:hypothetical protein TNCV_1241891 [Trichonephila clavipes]|nr:hypothetical protein TNCV_1241891 [Trichonephila clavipes]